MDKHLKEAIETYERNIKSGELFYMDASTLVDIESYYEKQNMDYEAEQCLRFAKQLHPDDEEVLITEAYRLKMKGHCTEAYRIIKQLPNQQHSEVQLFYIEWNVTAGQVEKAMELYDKYMEIPCTEIDKNNFIFDMSEILVDYGYSRRAIRLLTQIPSSYPEYKRTLELLADAYYQTADYVKAEEVMQQMVDLNPYDAYSWAQLADVQQKVGLYDDALESCEYALAINPELQAARTLQVFVLFRLARTDEALKLIATYKNDAPDDYAMFMYAGGALFEKKQFDKAITYYDHAMAYCPVNSPDRQNVVTDLSLCRAVCGHLQEGLELYGTTAPTSSDILDFYQRVFALLVDSNRTKEAIDIVRIVLNIKKEQYLTYADIYDVLNQHEWFHEAKDIWETLFEGPTPEEQYGRYYFVRLKAAKILNEPSEYVNTLCTITEKYPIQAAELIKNLDAIGQEIPRKDDGQLDFAAIGLQMLREKMTGE